MSYDEPEPMTEEDVLAEQPAAADQEGRITVQLDGWDASAVRRMIEQRVVAKIGVAFDDAAEKAATAAVARAIDQAVTDRIGAAVDAALAEGFQPTDSYGYPRGEKKSLRQFIVEAFQRKGSGYDDRGLTLVEATAKAAIDAALKTEFAKEIAAAKESFKGLLDNSIKGQLTEALKSVLGVGR